MHRLAILATVTLLGLAPLMGPVAAQDSTPDTGSGLHMFEFGPNAGRWDQVSRPMILAGKSTAFASSSALQPFDVAFNEQYAAVPPITNAEFMIVEIVAGEFALEVPQDGNFIVDRPDGSPIEYLQIVPDEPYYLPTGTFVLDVSSSLCTHFCAIPVGKAVKLQAGDRTIAQAGSICIWCFLNAPGAVVGPGLMRIYVLLAQDASGDLRPFSWIEDWDRNQAAPSTPEARVPSTMLAWAFNPQARCRSGGG